jgi:hypothetical protein
MRSLSVLSRGQAKHEETVSRTLLSHFSHVLYVNNQLFTPKPENIITVTVSGTPQCA